MASNRPGVLMASNHPGAVLASSWQFSGIQALSQQHPGILVACWRRTPDILMASWLAQSSICLILQIFKFSNGKSKRIFRCIKNEIMKGKTKFYSNEIDILPMGFSADFITFPISISKYFSSEWRISFCRQSSLAETLRLQRRSPPFSDFDSH